MDSSTSLLLSVLAGLVCLAELAIGVWITPRRRDAARDDILRRAA